jgi:hypothetical protein
MKRLEDWKMITQKSNNKRTTVSICNWKSYQITECAERTADEQQMNNERTTSEQRVNTIEEGKESKEGKEVGLSTTLSKSEKPDSKKKAFKPPTAEEVTTYCESADIDLDADEIEKLVDYYESKGWKVGKAPMKNWQAAVRNWARNDFRQKPESKSQPCGNSNLKYLD